MNIPVPFSWALRMSEEFLQWKSCDLLTWDKSPAQMMARKRFICSRPEPAYPTWTEPHVRCAPSARSAG